MNNPKSRQQWLLDELKSNPSTSYVEMFAKYSQEFAKSSKTFDKDWLKANEQLKSYQDLINKARLEQSIETEKEAVKRDILSKQEAMEILTTIARSEKEKSIDKKGAIETLAKLDGWNAPTRKDITTNGKEITNVSIDMSKLSDSALEEIENACIKEESDE